MKCSECGKKVDENHKVRLPIGPNEYDDAFPCTGCGRLHWPEGSGVSNTKTGKKAYWLDGKIESKLIDS